ncbi:hypothetical protein [Myroides odoratus]|uniref:hypothetical protein n=1 Tax=Myroides odoratus TaxID=256 RepID=UPI0039AF585E
METRDTILRLIQQTALILRAFFNQLPEDDSEQVTQDFTARLKEQTSVDLEVLLSLETPQQIQDFFALHPAFDTSNQEVLADLLVDLAEKMTNKNFEVSLQYKKSALNLYRHINKITQTHDSARQNKINKLS